MTATQLEIRTLTTAREMIALSTVFQQVWGSITPLVEAELLTAIAHSGGYVAGAFDQGNIIGASFGFLARHRGTPALHSHVTGILPGVQHSGVGRVMKNHQRAWAHAAGLEWVTWTFDPLVRRNAWFNIEVLGAVVDSYHENFYGPLEDNVNSGDETDRLLVAWATTAPETAVTESTPTSPSHTEGVVAIPTPADVVVLRRTAPAEAQQWRHTLRAELGRRLASGGRVIGFTRAGEYLVVES